MLPTSVALKVARERKYSDDTDSVSWTPPFRSPTSWSRGVTPVIPFDPKTVPLNVQRGFASNADRSLNERHYFGSLPCGSLWLQEALSFLQQIPAIAVLVLYMAVNSVTFGTMLFSATSLVDAKAVLPNGIICWLLSTFAGHSSAVCCSRVKYMVGNGTLEMIPIFHALFQGIAKDLPGASQEEVASTCLAAVFVGTFSTGVLLAVGARFGLGNRLRAVPLVVLKGALFGVALFMMQSVVHTAAPVPQEEVWDAWPRWTTAILLGSILFFIDEVTQSPFLCAMMLLGVAMAPTFVSAFGVSSIEELRDAGWLFPEEISNKESWYQEHISTLSTAVYSARWSVAFKNGPAFLGTWLTHGLVSLMDLKAIDILTEAECDIGSELKAMGYGNMLSACFGGWPTNFPTGPVLTFFKLGAHTKSAGVVLQMGVISILFVSGRVVPCLPYALPGCVTWWLGCTFFKGTMVDILRQHSKKSDIVIVAAMAILMVQVGFVEGLLAGLILAMGEFTLQHMGKPLVVRTTGDATTLRSNLWRTIKQYEVLDKVGHQVCIIYLGGNLMFCSSPELFDIIQPMLRVGGPDYVVLNCRGLWGLDYSGAFDLHNLGRKAALKGCSIVLTELKAELLESLDRVGVQLQELPRTPLLADKPSGLFYVEHYNNALKACEDALLSAHGHYVQGLASPDMKVSWQGLSLDKETKMIAQTFGDFLGEDAEDLFELRRCFQRFEYQPGEVLWRVGDPATYFLGVVQGELHVFYEGPQGGSPREVRPFLMEVVGPGAVIGSGPCLNRMPHTYTLQVRGEPGSDGEMCVALRLLWSTFTDLTETRPKLALAITRVLLRRFTYEVRDLSRSLFCYHP